MNSFTETFWILSLLFPFVLIWIYGIRGYIASILIVYIGTIITTYIDYHIFGYSEPVEPVFRGIWIVFGISFSTILVSMQAIPIWGLNKILNRHQNQSTRPYRKSWKIEQLTIKQLTEMKQETL
jgi:hypothetical protein